MQPMIEHYGAHVSVAGGFENGIKNAAELGVNTIQIHPSPPQRWNRNPYKEDYEKKFLEENKTAGVEKIFFHAIYLINLVTPALDKLSLAKLSLKHYLELSARIGGEGVIVHVGSLKDEPDELKGFKRAAQAIDEIMEETPEESYLILEVAAGSGRVVGSQFEELQKIYEHIKNQDRVGFGLDTQHMWASGYDLQNKLEQVVANIDEAFGMEKVWCIHLNDSKTELASKKDRHENLGDGLIGEKALKAFLARPEFTDIPFVLETPALKDMETAKAEVEKLRSWIG